jgi:hypothetical protein
MSTLGFMQLKSGIERSPYGIVSQTRIDDTEGSIRPIQGGVLLGILTTPGKIDVRLVQVHLREDLETVRSWQILSRCRDKTQYGTERERTHRRSKSHVLKATFRSQNARHQRPRR